ncbi:hypothetical protein DL546_005577 [Coniochaeta pulveracea]|uniref:DUF7918 domain-containing protein n=1 Tax=Coniochaeta pulveracea TaxID=177199 RepID=A0A420YGF6_9PEZI|nr:hypothetical protein DL546_005577 [Coniochaeta pulveracea]
MAIFPDLGISVTVHINDTPTVEYDDPEPQLETKINRALTRVCGKYIKSELNSRYTIVCEVWPRHTWIGSKAGNELAFHAFVDGMPCGQWILCRQNLIGGHARITISGADLEDDESAETINEFRFHAINKVESATASSSERETCRAKALGTIRVEVWRANDGSKHSIMDFYDAEENVDSDDDTKYNLLEKPADTNAPGAAKKSEDLRVSETALKGQAISHGTAFGESIPAGDFITVDSARTDDEHPFAIFNLKYRSKRDLLKEMIIPRTPSPTPEEFVGRLTEEEIRKLAIERLMGQDARMRNGPQDGRGAKREHAEANHRSNGRPNKRLKNTTEIIDLT